jgi:hypothetical protein
MRHKSYGGVALTRPESTYLDFGNNNNLCVIPELPADLVTSMEF